MKNKTLNLFVLFQVVLFGCMTGNISQNNKDIYYVLEVDSTMFKKFNFIVSRNYLSDTLFLISEKNLINSDTFNKYEIISKYKKYKLFLEPFDTTNKIEVHKSLSKIDNLEIKYGNYLIWKDEKLKQRFYYSKNIFHILIKKE